MEKSEPMHTTIALETAINNRWRDLQKRSLSALVMSMLVLGLLLQPYAFITYIFLFIIWCVVQVEWYLLSWPHRGWSMFGLFYTLAAFWGLSVLYTLDTMLLLHVIALVAMCDIGAYFAGRIIGGAKIAPSISPSKTWAGFGGAVFAASLYLLALEFSPIKAVGCAVAVSVVEQMGDFLESYIKRRKGVKDSGKLLPGHGGVLDRIDGLMPVAFMAAILFSSGICNY